MSIKNLRIDDPVVNGNHYVVFDGIAYHRNGWFGCQISSIERKKPQIGTRRVLKTLYYCYEFEIFSVERIGLFTYKCNWRLPQHSSYAEYGKQICKMLDDIFNTR